MNTLRTEKLSVAIEDRHLITDLDWRAARGEFWCVLGENGVGKTSLLYALAGLLKPASGTVLIDDVDIHTLSTQDMAHKRGLMAQQQVDAFSNSVLASVLIGRAPYRVGRSWDSNEDREAALVALTTVGMRAKIDADVTVLSGGERQRVALATLLVQAPDLMLLDEPTAHQDVAQQLMMMRLIRGLTSNHAVVITCHDINLAARFATHVLVLSPDRHWLGPVDEMLTVDVLQQAFDCRFDMLLADGVRSFIAH